MKNFCVGIAVLTITCALGFFSAQTWRILESPQDVSSFHIQSIDKSKLPPVDTLNAEKQVCNPAHNRYFVWPLSKLAEGESGCYEFARSERVNGIDVPAGTTVSVEIKKMPNGKTGLFTSRDAIVNGVILGKGAQMPYGK